MHLSLRRRRDRQDGPQVRCPRTPYPRVAGHPLRDRQERGLPLRQGRQYHNFVLSRRRRNDCAKLHRRQSAERRFQEPLATGRLRLRRPARPAVDLRNRGLTRLEFNYVSGGNYVTRQTAYQYDDLNRVTGTLVDPTANALTATVWFDALGRQALTEDPAGQQRARLYDGLGRITRAGAGLREMVFACLVSAAPLEYIMQ